MEELKKDVAGLADGPPSGAKPQGWEEPFTKELENYGRIFPTETTKERKMRESIKELLKGFVIGAVITLVLYLVLKYVGGL